jgi:hypothetical protein
MVKCPGTGQVWWGRGAMKWRSGEKNRGKRKVHGITPFLEAKFLYFAMK